VRKLPPIYKECVICKKEFLRPPGRKNVPYLTCSPVCRGARRLGIPLSEETKAKLRDIQKAKTTYTQVPCAVCGKTLDLAPWQIRLNLKTCGGECGKTRLTIMSKSEEHRFAVAAAHRGKPNPHTGLKGARNPNWRGGITGADAAERNKFATAFRKLVFEGDKYTCRLCGREGGHLHVDHVKPWSENTGLRFDLDNCRTLCRGCHYEVTFGKPMALESNKWGLHRRKSA